MTATTQTPFTITASPVKGYSALTNRLGQELLVESDTLDLISNLIDAGSHIFLYGAAGTAKTELAEAILASKGKTVFQMETGSITSGDQLDGERTLDNDGKLTTVPSELLKAMREAAKGNPTGLVLDELNRVAAPAAVNKLLRPLSAQREYATDLNGVLDIGTNLSFVATANIGYFGTTRLNEALLDRFDAIEMKPISGDALAYMLTSRYPSVDKKVITRLVKFVDNNRKHVQNDPDAGIAPISTRDALRILRGVSVGLSPIDAITRLVGGQLAILQMDQESIDGLVAEAKSQFAGM